MENLIKQLNEANELYYSTGTSPMDDALYDTLYAKLEKMEKEMGVAFASSPTQRVGYEISKSLDEVQHDHQMLSLDKKHSVEEVQKWLQGKPAFISCKCDGLSLSLTYEDGKLAKAETRGDGQKGKNVLLHALVFDNIPKIIPSTDKMVIDGEAVIRYSDFNAINAEGEYKNPRNLAAGSLSLLDNSISAKRHLRFYAWRVVQGLNSNSYSDRMKAIQTYGFEIAPYIDEVVDTSNIQQLEQALQKVKALGKEYEIPIDGAVIAIDDIQYGESLGATSKFPYHSMAYKYEDEVYPSTLKNIEWSVGRTGNITPVAIFNPVDIEGSEVSRASLHNTSIIENLGLTNNCTVYVKKCNLIIPQIDSCDLDGDGEIIYPDVCPSCGQSTRLVEDKNTPVLMCENENCPAKLLSKFSHFVGKAYMNIDGLSEATLEKLIDMGFISTYADIFNLSQYKAKIIRMEGFGEKSYKKLIDSIEKARNVKFENYLASLGIEQIGRTKSKALSKYFNQNYQDFIEALNSNFDFTTLEDFGMAAHDSLYNWKNSENVLEVGLTEELTFIIEETKRIEEGFCTNKNFVVTGKFDTMPRKNIEKLIEAQGGKLQSSVSKVTDYLLNNDSESQSSKNVKARKLGIPIMTEKEFLEKIL